MTRNKKIEHVLIVDDEKVVRKGISRALANRNIRATEALNGKEALRHLKARDFDLILLDIKMEDMDGTEVLQQIRRTDPEANVVMITGYPTIATAVHCTKLGALDYLTKPFSLDDLDAALSKVQSGKTGKREPFTTQTGIKQDSPKHLIVGNSPPMKKIFEKIARVAPTESSVLISGESGTGKELVARAIHANSNRKDMEFVAVDCSALVETLLESELFGHVKGSFTGAHQTKHGLFELANHGTFFFDEITNLSLKIQAKLLRVIQEREFMKVGDQHRIKLDVRIIAASNTPLSEAIQNGTFREDLFYRLSVVPLELPPLRNRKEDIQFLIEHFLEKLSHKMKKPPPEISSEAINLLKEYPWPGNVRELEHAIERILILEDADIIQERNLPSYIIQQQGDLQLFPEDPITLLELEKKYIAFVLKKTKGKKIEAARILGINRKTLSAKINKYALK
ncbi:MAG: sigma-54-dependent Fis family transcriptional regulator [Deltaproteobacteria bacterium]|nr:sigma-54-dependent Fis family transcriptional regulator [Deltaproteobacteria bacterium]